MKGWGFEVDLPHVLWKRLLLPHRFLYGCGFSVQLLRWLFGFEFSTDCSFVSGFRFSVYRLGFRFLGVGVEG